MLEWLLCVCFQDVSGWTRVSPGGFGVVSGWLRVGSGGFGLVRVGSDGFGVAPGGFGWARVGSGWFGWVRVGSGGFGWVRVIPPFSKYGKWFVMLIYSIVSLIIQREIHCSLSIVI